MGSGSLSPVTTLGVGAAATGAAAATAGLRMDTWSTSVQIQFSGTIIMRGRHFSQTSPYILHICEFKRRWFTLLQVDDLERERGQPPHVFLAGSRWFHKRVHTEVHSRNFGTYSNTAYYSIYEHNLR